MEQSKSFFYKRAVANRSMLRQNLMIEFSGEEGADAGALLYEFCEEVVHKVDEDYFEGQEDRRVPKCHWGSAFELEMAGAMVAHSILQGGPGLPCLHPAVFHTMVSGEAQAITTLTENELPTAKDIPRNASTYDILEMIDQVCTIVTFSQASCIITITLSLCYCSWIMQALWMKQTR